MIRKLPLILLFIFTSLQAQEKIKGSRNVTTEQYELDAFHSIEVYGEFEVGILRGSRPLIEIEADDNLHNLIQSEVNNGVLHIKPLKDFNRTKSQKIRITFADTLKRIKVSDKVELESLQDLFVKNFQLETRNDSKVKLKITADTLDLTNNDNSKIEMNLKAEKVIWQLNQSSDIKALVQAPIFNVDIYEKASAKVEGETDELDLRSDQSAKFDGEELASIRAIVLSQGNSKNKVNVAEVLELTAKGNSETEVYNNPEVKLIEFTDKAVISKKEFGRGIFN
ncbi:GIN domain-containing protein [Christiangramia salexigens]|uniref:Putative auto-transporter adhesin head GIN domain-containing protein n=1 Tax=Christiangramia salexigens TaxID=1913577 RepID=A0A1L3J3T2_9FLAO|nr:DUF2807 domain-containing protein [Christiangramia salexigens]APG59795.1 hypothetical protein LPB144_04905 [Christiangramia salexigens]